MTIDPRLHAAHLLPVSYDQRLPERYVFSPANRVSDKSPHPYRTVIDIQDCYDRGKCLRYKQDGRTGSVQAVTMTGILQKGALVDIMA